MKTGEQPRPSSHPGVPDTFQRSPSPGVDAPVAEVTRIPLRGAAARIVENMEASLAVPTATSQRIIPVKLLEENRRIMNDHMQARGRGKISLTHVIAWAVVKSLREFRSLNSCYEIVDGVPCRTIREYVNIGIAIDLERKDGSRSLLVPSIKAAHAMNFLRFVRSYEDLVSRVRQGAADVADLQGTTVTLTNPGTVGTSGSLPRLMPGQGAIIATGAIAYPPEYHAWSSETLSSRALSKVMTVTCTYDHRIIQGAESGQFLGRIESLLVGAGQFYEELFESLELHERPYRTAVNHAPSSPQFGSPPADLEKQAGVLQLINLYRVRGHLVARLDPLGRRALYHPELDPATYGLNVWDLDREFSTGGLADLAKGSLRTILEILKNTYCKKIGIEYRHIQAPDEKAWIQSRIEPSANRSALDLDSKRRILEGLMRAESFEKFLHARFVGHKRFGLEGAETTIPVLQEILRQCAAAGVPEAVIGMAHRGRLNVLANVIGKPLATIFCEFEENVEPLVTQGSGDVKYHLGARGIFSAPGGREISVSVAPNPSHLEWVNPVVEGIVRAKQERRGDHEHEQVVPILIHGDAAFAGQGVVAETLNLSQLHGYRTGGTVHIIINNQIGFTTTPEEARSTPYATDIAKSVQAPIFHVNGDEPEAAIRVARLAFAYRQHFKKDVLIDIFCYRRHGHNEGDEPSYTQPVLYKIIQDHPSVLTQYCERLVGERSLALQEVEDLRRRVHEWLDEAHEDAKGGRHSLEPDIPLAVSEEELREFQPSGGTDVERETLLEVCRGLTRLPAGFTLHPKLQPWLEKRRELLVGDPEIDWAFAEALAFGTLVFEGTPVRLSGQDSARGTFSQRHLVLCDLDTGEEYIPLQHIHPHQADFDVYDSLLSEAAVLGFEFGYSAADPLTLVLWEAQFGDFANGAQIIIDNFIASAEAKWRQPCDLVLLLPHGFEGQGPEHSSARLERFLSLCADANLQVCNPSSAAQYFHLLRRQMRDAKQKPLVVMTPKSLLRHPAAAARAAQLSGGRFEVVLDDPSVTDRDDVRRILLCSGKLSYELMHEKEKRQGRNVAVVRLEQLYPFPGSQLNEVLGLYPRAGDIAWTQEEPENMGAWPFVRRYIPDSMPFGIDLKYVGRRESASPAAGSRRTHYKEQAELVAAAFQLG